MRKVLKILSIGVATLIIYIFVAPVILWVIGYYPDGVGWKVAQEIAEKNGQASDCKKIIHTISHPFSPTAEEQRSSCIYDYARLTKDPSACELLMPSEYGLSCINQSIDSLFKENQDAEHINIDADCSIYNANPLRKDYCLFSQAHKTKDLNTCEEITDLTIKSACNEKIGAWFKYPELRTSSYFGQYREL